MIQGNASIGKRISREQFRPAIGRESRRRMPPGYLDPVGGSFLRADVLTAPALRAPERRTVNVERLPLIEYRKFAIEPPYE